jgi:glycosyltransferase involved in cell wall biosynthesis
LWIFRKIWGVNDLKEKIRHILENPQEGKEMVERGKRQIMKNLAWDKVVRKWRRFMRIVVVLSNG